MTNVLSDFFDAIRATGLEPPDAFEPGRLVRIAGIGKSRSNRAGWCVLFRDGLGGSFGDWSSGLSATWQAKGSDGGSHANRARIAQRVRKARALAEADRQSRNADAASRALALWRQSLPATDDHLYLRAKGILPHGTRLKGNALVLPVIDFAGRLTTLQFVGPDGQKRLLRGGRKSGCFIPVTLHQYPRISRKGHVAPVSADNANSAYVLSKIVICEGWATGCTLAEHEPNSMVLAAIDAGNLQSVALNARYRWPTAEIVVAGDDDRLAPGNPGATKARAAAITSGSLLVLPQWPEGAPMNLTDFNDLAVWLARGGA